MKNPVLPSDNPQRIEALRRYHFRETITALVTFEIPTENRYNPRTILIANVPRSPIQICPPIPEPRPNHGKQTKQRMAGRGRREYR